MFVEGILQITPQVVGDVLRHAKTCGATSTPASSRIPTSGKPTYIAYPDRGQNAFNPRLTTSYRAGDHTVLYASAYRSFRAPTLNELYRAFGSAMCRRWPIAFLRAEHFTGGEGGVRATMLSNRMPIHGVGFWGIVTDPVANVTLSSTPQLDHAHAGEPGAHASRSGFRPAPISASPTASW